MSKLSREDVLKLAALSRLKLCDSEVEQFSSQLSEILGYVEQLNEVDVSGIDPTYQVTGLKNVMRPDIVRNYGYTSDDLMANAPDEKDHQFKVKRVL